MSDIDLFGLAAGPILTPSERKRLTRSKPAGLYAAIPGSGPEFETCGTCVNLYRKVMGKTYLKCKLTQAKWTGGGGTDVKAKSPACSKWQSAERRERA